MENNESKGIFDEIEEEETKLAQNNDVSKVSKQTKTKKSDKWIFALPILIGPVLAIVVYLLIFKTNFINNILEAPVIGVIILIISFTVPGALFIGGIVASIGAFATNEVMNKVDELSSSSNPKDNKKANIIIAVIIAIIAAIMIYPYIRNLFNSNINNCYKYSYTAFVNDNNYYNR